MVNDTPHETTHRAAAMTILVTKPRQAHTLSPKNWTAHMDRHIAHLHVLATAGTCLLGEGITQNLRQDGKGTVTWRVSANKRCEQKRIMLTYTRLANMLLEWTHRKHDVTHYCGHITYGCILTNTVPAHTENKTANMACTLLTTGQTKQT